MKQKITLLVSLLVIFSLFTLSVSFADEHLEDIEEIDDEEEVETDDDDSDDLDDDMILSLSREDAIDAALNKLSDYENLTLDEIDFEDNGYEIEFISTMYEIEVFVDSDGVVTIEDIDEKDVDEEEVDISDEDVIVNLTQEEAIALALNKLSDYENLTVDEIDVEDNGYEIEFISTMYEIEVFVDADGLVTIEKVEEEVEDDEQNLDEKRNDSADSRIYTKTPSVLISEAIAQIQLMVEGQIIEIKLKSSDDKLYWDAETNLKEQVELDATSGEVREFKSEVNGTEVEFKSEENESEIKVKSGDDEFEAKGSKGFFGRLFSFFN